MLETVVYLMQRSKLFTIMIGYDKDTTLTLTMP